MFARMRASLEKLNLSFGDAVKMTVFLVGLPKLDGRLGFAGFMCAYTKHFGTEAQPDLPARSDMLVEEAVVLTTTR